MLNFAGESPARNSNRRKIFRNAAIFAILILVTACATTSQQQWAAHGYLTPGPTGDPELIGVYDNLDECNDAAEEWTTQQVVGNPVFAECYPVDHN